MSAPDPSVLDRLAGWLRRLPGARSSGDTIAGQVGEGARGVVIGKNVIQIERFVFPLWLIGLFVLAVILAAVIAWLRVVPAQMPVDTFNVAVATFGEEGPDGRIRPSDRGAWFSRVTYEVLDESQTDEKVILWHDSMGWSEKRARIGLVTDDNVAELTERLNAHVLVYGHLMEDGGLALNFYAHPDLQSLTDSLIIGRYDFGEPVAFQADFDPRESKRAERFATTLLRPRVVSLSALLRGFLEYSVGAVETALAIWQQATTAPGGQGGPGEGEEAIQMLIGVAHLTPVIRGERIIYEPEKIDQAEAAFEQAGTSPFPSVSSRAQIGLGSVHFLRAQLLLDEREPSEETVAQAQRELQRAIANYEEARARIQQMPEPDPLLDALAQIALTPAYRLQGEAHLVSGDLALAADPLDRAIQGVEDNLPPLVEAEEYRMVAQGYQVMGTALIQRAWLAAQQGDAQLSTELYVRAVEALDTCVAQGTLDIDEFLQLIAKSCEPTRATAQTLLEESQGGEE